MASGSSVIMTVEDDVDEDARCHVVLDPRPHRPCAESVNEFLAQQLPPEVRAWLCLAVGRSFGLVGR